MRSDEVAYQMVGWHGFTTQVSKERGEQDLVASLEAHEVTGKRIGLFLPYQVLAHVSAQAEPQASNEGRSIATERMIIQQTSSRRLVDLPSEPLPYRQRPVWIGPARDAQIPLLHRDGSSPRYQRRDLFSK
jgi:hypothetical protein